MTQHIHIITPLRIHTSEQSRGYIYDRTQYVDITSNSNLQTYLLTDKAMWLKLLDSEEPP